MIKISCAHGQSTSMKKHLSLTQAYLLSFAVLAMWAIFAYLTMYNQIQEQERYAKLINISGKQRMLSQRTALLASQYLTTSDLTFLEELKKTRALMERDHNVLLENIPSDSLKQIYLNEPYSLDAKAKRYFALLEDFIASSNTFDAIYIFERSSRLLPDLDYAVKKYEKESDLKNAQLMKIEGYILFGTILTLFLEALIIIRPTLRYANLNTRQLAEMVHEKTQELTQSLEKLTTEISTRKKMEAEKEKLLAAIHQTRESIVITDASARIQYVNPAFEAITGYRSEEVLGQNPRILQSGEHDQEFYKSLWKELAEGRSWKGEIINKKKDGTLYSEEASISPVHDEIGKIINYVAVKSDVTEKIANEKHLRLKNKMEAVGHLAGGIAHNFNNNLSVILGNIEMAMIKNPENHDAISFLEKAKIAVGRSRDLVQGIIAYSRQDSHEKVSTSLLEIIKETISLLQATIPSTIKIIQSHSPECETKRISAAPSQIQEILINLCNNAVHAMDEEGTITIHLLSTFLSSEDIPSHETCLPGNYVKLSVNDTGCGIPQEILDNIFDPFFTTKEMYEGTGMGLATVQGIVAQHGGMIQVESQPDHGTAFHIFFPAIEKSQTELEDIALETEPLIVVNTHGTEHILFVDDDEMLAELGEKMLIEGGYQVTTITSSTAALTLFEQTPDLFDLVITDQTMPDLSGRDLITALKKINDKVPVILCTGFSTKVDEETAKKQGIDAFLMKPLKMDELLKSVRQILDTFEHQA